MKEIKLLIPTKFAVDEAAALREKLNHLLSEGYTDFVLDFNECTFIDSTGLGVLITIYKKCEEVQGSFKLLSIAPQVMKVFQLTRLDKVFDIR